MRIAVPAQDAEGNRLPDVIKQVIVGCGVTIRIEGSRWLAQGTVTRIYEDDVTLDVHGVGFQAIMNVSAVIDCNTPADQQWQSIYDQNISLTHRPTEELEGWDALAEEKLHGV